MISASSVIVSDDIAVMYLGRSWSWPAGRNLRIASHPYTKSLLSAGAPLSRSDIRGQRQRII